jgi:predicted dehydrogenase
MEPLNIITVAQVGVGYWGPNLLRNMVANRGCRVKTVVDLAQERRDYVKGLYPAVNVTDNVQQVLDDPEIDAVVIATPAGNHFEMSMKALEAGKHILVEKPIAKTVGEVDQIGELAAKKNLLVMVGHTFIYNSAVRYLKALITSGELGDIRYMYSKRLNLGRIRTDVDALWNFAPHDISIIQYLLGDPEPTEVTRMGMGYIQDDVDDVVFLNVKYPGKIMANIHVSWLDPVKIRSLTVVGSKKMVVYDDVAENKIAIYDKGIDKKAVLGENMDFDNPSAWKFSYRSGDIVFPKIDFKEPLKEEVEHFLDSIRNRDEQCLTSIDHAREVIRILSATNGEH